MLEFHTEIILLHRRALALEVGYKCFVLIVQRVYYQSNTQCTAALSLTASEDIRRLAYIESIRLHYSQ